MYLKPYLSMIFFNLHSGKQFWLVLRSSSLVGHEISSPRRDEPNGSYMIAVLEKISREIWKSVRAFSILNKLFSMFCLPYVYNKTYTTGN